MTKRDKRLCSISGCHHKAAIDLGIIWNISPSSYRYYCSLHSIEIIELFNEKFGKSDLKKQLEKEYKDSANLKPKLDKRLL